MISIVIILGVVVCLLIVASKCQTQTEDECECCNFEGYGIRPIGGKCITQNVYRNRDGKRQKVGILVSCQKKGKVKVGYSLCCKTDEFSEREAYVIASQRMADATLTPPQSLKKDLIKFVGRCNRYYKDATVATFDGKTIVNP